MSIHRTCLAFVLAAGSASALAQNALDRPLRQDLRVNGSSGYTRPDFAAEVRLRNALVTGNVGGGKSLQIAAPYSGLGDFQGTLGSDSLFAFRRDSFGFSDTNTFRNSDALTFQTLYSTGNSLAQPNILSRFGSNGTSPYTSASAAASNLPTILAERRPTSPNETLPPGALRSTGEYISTRTLNPTLIGFQQTKDGENRITASSLLGVRADLTKTADQQFNDGAGLKPSNSAAADPIKSSAQATPDNGYQTAYDLLREKLNANVIDNSVNAPAKPADATKPTDATPPAGTIKPNDANKPNDTTTKPPTAPGEAPSTPSDSGAPNTSPPGSNTPGTKPTSPGGTPLDSPLGTGLPGTISANTPDPADANLRPWEKRMRDLRHLLETPDPKTTNAGAQGINADPTPQQRAMGLDTPEKVQGAMAGLDDQTLAILRTPVPKLNTYLSGEPRPGDLYAQQLFDGQKYLSEGKYFDAEERFASAAAMRPGDVTSLVGRINSQLGAGLYVSAAVNLRSLYARHPEVIGLRFTGAAVPKIDRMTALLIDLRDQIARSKAAGIPPRAECTFLLAYVGYQLENVDAVRDGLNETKALAARDPAQADPLQNVLEAVWLYHDPRAIPSAPSTPTVPPAK